jgi:hypothetical protein
MSFVASEGCVPFVPFVVAVFSAAFVSFVTCAAQANAQVYESVGIRAQGMAGAFVAVADDADAAWWNPAGLAGGSYFNAIIEYGTSQEPRAATDPSGLPFTSWRSGARAFTVAFPALALSYYRLTVSEIQPSGATGAAAADRQDRGSAPVLLTSLLLQQFGATFGQSVGEHFVVGSTVTIDRGSFASAVTSAAAATLDRAGDLEANSQTAVDFDVGALATFGGFRIGAAIKHMTEPTIGIGDQKTTLNRQARLGLSMRTPASGGAGRRIVIAADADLTRTRTAVGDARHLAAGGEVWLENGLLGVRGGGAVNTVGDLRPSASGGVSLALRRGTFVDAQVTGGSDQALKSWGVALRVAY